MRSLKCAHRVIGTIPSPCEVVRSTWIFLSTNKQLFRHLEQTWPEVTEDSPVGDGTVTWWAWPKKGCEFLGWLWGTGADPSFTDQLSFHVPVQPNVQKSASNFFYILANHPNYYTCKIYISYMYTYIDHQDIYFFVCGSHISTKKRVHVQLEKQDSRPGLKVFDKNCFNQTMIL